MNDVDWTLLIGFPQNEAENTLRDESIVFQTKMTSSPKRRNDAADGSEEDIRVIGVRYRDSHIELVCAAADWSIN